MKEELANISKKDYDMWYEALAKMCHPGLEFLRTHGFTVEELSESAIRGERSCRDCNRMFSGIPCARGNEPPC